MFHDAGKRLLQAVVAVLALTPVLAGAAGVVLGPSFLGLQAPWPADLDSHFRFLSALFLLLGCAWYSCIPAIEVKTARFRLLAALTFAGGLGRLWSLIVVGTPSTGHIAGLAVELAAVPLLVLWQAQIAEKGARS